MIPLNKIEIIVLIVARESPKNLKVTSLQLTAVLLSSCFNNSAEDKFSEEVPKSHTNDSLKKPFSIPTCWDRKRFF